MARLYTADYAPGNLSQWQVVQNKYTDGAVNRSPGYPVQVIGEGDAGHAGRFEMRSGDSRSEVGEATATTLTPANTTRWYAWSQKFDSTFPADHTSLGWGVTQQWHSNTVVVGSPTIMMGWQGGVGGGTPAGYVSLWQQPQSTPGTLLGNVRLCDFPLDVGHWHDIKMQVLWSTSDATGTVAVWYDGVRQTLLPGGTTFTGRTMIPGDSYVHYHEGYYRDSAITATGIVYRKGFRIADAEADL